MRKLIGVGFGLAVATLSASNAFAYENFIPLGLGYSTQNVEISQLTSQERAAIGRADIYETELYRRQLELKKLQSRFDHSLFEKQGSSFDDAVEY